MNFVKYALLAFIVLSSPALANGQGAYRDGAYPKAFEAFLPLANSGDAESQYYLGLMYSKGQAVPQDAIMAVSWYQKAADQGHPLAQNNLGFMYGQGSGVKKDFVQAHMWYSLAAAAGIVLSQENRALIALKMTSRQITEGQRLAREWMAQYKGAGMNDPQATKIKGAGTKTQ
ncbi:MAG: sel1 repeat family protein [Rhodospirillaceae bacterium]|jgi:uncharacterized protein|nr:sel1 repeat family protein [Rhodospirillaceae bacterium]MBT5667007.1 sel1 repeat family protein [Rhodospirillaceae bacterium]MBT5811711.1 sel1 repeat family protein [Rhodospirillaceae bacterium]